MSRTYGKPLQWGRKLFIYHNRRRLDDERSDFSELFALAQTYKNHTKTESGELKLVGPPITVCIKEGPKKYSLAMEEATVEDDYAHAVFQVDPRGLLALIGKYVEVTTQDGGVCSGFLFASDPVSKSLVISLPVGDTFTSRLLPGDSVRDIVELEAPPGVQLTQEIERISRLTAEEAKTKRETIVQWLRKNLLPVSVNGELIDVHEGSLLIYPPYESTDCVTDNPIVLGRMQHLLRSLPKE